MEIWKDVTGYEGLYKISNRGNAIGPKGQLKIRKLKSGYCYISCNKDGTSKKFYIHRLVAQEFIPNPENKSEVNHINGNKSDNDVNNLEWNTRLQNINHAFDNNLYKHGEEHKQSKLSNADVEYIRKHYIYRDKNFSSVALAERFGVSSRLIRGIVNNKKRTRI